MNPALYDLAKDSMSQEQLDTYKRLGEDLYNTIDYTTNSVLDSDPVLESVAQIVETIKSGMDVSYLDEEDRTVMQEWGGKEWYERVRTILHQVHK